MPTNVTAWATSQSRSARSPAVVVENSWLWLSRRPRGPGTRTQAITVSLCTSRPATRSVIVSILPLLVEPPKRVVPGGLIAWSLRFALAAQ
jgi:hypothetical protein